MKTVIIAFPASNCARDIAVAVEQQTGIRPIMLRHDDVLPSRLDWIILPGGFSYGDYLRPGSIAARAPILADIAAAARRGVAVLGICNGFQILTECGLLPGALRRNRDGRFIHAMVQLSVNPATPFTTAYAERRAICLPIAHGDGRYVADRAALERLEGEGCIIFRYGGNSGSFYGADDGGNPNGSAHAIAGISSLDGRVLGLMPHPERAIDPVHGSVDGRGLFRSIHGGRGDE